MASQLRAAKRYKTGAALIPKKHRNTDPDTLGVKRVLLRAAANGNLETRQMFPSFEGYLDILKRHKLPLKGGQKYTVFVWANMDPDAGTNYVIGRRDEADLLRMHVARGDISLDTLKTMGRLPTLADGDPGVLLSLIRNDTVVIGGDSQVIQGDLRFRQGRIHIVDVPFRAGGVAVSAMYK